MGLWRAARHLRAEGIHMPIYATCLIVGTPSNQIAILTLDLMLLSVTQVKSIRAATNRVTNIDEQDIWVFVSHNHAGPATLENYIGEGELAVRAYCNEIPLLCASAAKKAIQSMEDVRVAAGRGLCEVGINRDLQLPNGKFVIAPNPDGFADSEVGVIKIETSDGHPLAVIANYGCHPTIAGHENRLISPDYPGVAREIVERIAGGTCLFLQGAAGNVGPQEGFTAAMEVVERQGSILGCEVAKVALQTKMYKTRTVLDSVVESMSAQIGVMKQQRLESGTQALFTISRVVQIPTGNEFGLCYDKVEKEIEDLENKIAITPKNETETSDHYSNLIAINRLMWARDRGRRMLSSATYPVEIKALCIGDIALVGTWGEMFAETGHAIKQNSPFSDTFVSAYMGGDAAYLPLRDAYCGNPRLEVMNTPVAPGGAEVLQDSIMSMLADLKEIRIAASACSI
jgi:hypothetical protein